MHCWQSLLFWKADRSCGTGNNPRSRMNAFCLSPKSKPIFGPVIERISILLAEITTNCSYSPNGCSFLPAFWPPSLGVSVCSLEQAVTCCSLPAGTMQSLLQGTCTQLGEPIRGFNIVLLPIFFRLHMQK